jgi:hypothetical protein
MKLPKGYKVTTYSPQPDWWDCRVWKDGQMILSTSGTMFDFKDQAYNCGIRRANDINNGAKEWS